MKDFIPILFLANTLTTCVALLSISIMPVFSDGADLVVNFDRINKGNCATTSVLILKHSGINTVYYFQEKIPPLRVKSKEKTSKIPCKQSLSTYDQIEKDLIIELLNWIGKNTKYNISVALYKLPTIRFCRTGDTIDYEDKDIVLTKPIIAVCDEKKGLITIVQPWSPDNIQNVGTLLHELLHYVQLLNKKWLCWGRAEWEAYKLQAKWLTEHGEKPNFNWVNIILQTRCRRDIHP